MHIIAHLRNSFPSKFGIPRQSGVVADIKGRVVFEREYRVVEAFRDLDSFSHIWLLWQFSEAVRDKWSPTVRPPRLGGNTRVGVFATRSPFRPNPIGLSCVKLDRIELESAEGPVLHVSGADLMDNTPIYDIKPYLPFTDCVAEASGGLPGANLGEILKVNIDEKLLTIVPVAERETLRKILAGDPRPAYQNDQNRAYGFSYAGFEIRFSVADGLLNVIDISPSQL